MGFRRKENTGLDTETYKGYAKLICADDGDYKFLESFDDVIQFLTQNKFRAKYNWFFNIRFDFEALIKYLDYGELVELYNNNCLQYNDYFSISYLPSKYFSIKDNHNNNYYFYDMHNFLEMSLNKASETFLKDKKMNDIIDSKQLNTNLDYWNKNKENIIKYCIKDANLTKRLADYFWGIIYTNINFNPKSPLSKGKLSEEYFLHKCNIPPINDISYDILKTAYTTFYGGHFEILKRGYTEKAYSYDIKSAYPFEIANSCIDFTKGRWSKVTKKNDNAYTGFYKCRIESLEPVFSPFKQKVGGENGLNIYPNGSFIQYLTKKEIDFFEPHFPNSAIKIDFGWEFEPKEVIYPFKEEIERLYQWKEKEQNPEIKYCVKIILNSLYGKFIQVSGNNNQTGKLFNPIYAALITAGARVKILELALQKPDDVISFSTDSVICQSPLKTPKNPKMGDFALDFEGEGVFVMSDVYNLWNNKTKKVKSKLRGFSLATTKDYDSEEIYLKDILSKMDTTKYEYFTERPYHLGECLLHVKKRKIEDMNIFASVPKHIDINGDNKRMWEKEFKKGKDCLKELHSSIPLVYKT
jgi:hypothetical protein